MIRFRRFRNTPKTALPYPYVVHTAPQRTAHGTLQRFVLVGDNWVNDTEKPVVVLATFNGWKRGIISDFLHEYRTAFIPGRCPLLMTLVRLCSLKKPPYAFIFWGRKTPRILQAYATLTRTPIYRIEDGFVRSADLGARRVLPYSLVLDTTGIYFDGTRSSDIEHLLNTADITHTEQQAATYAIELIKTLQLSKYNLPMNANAPALPPRNGRKRVVILGQVDKDLSMVYGNPENWDARRMIETAVAENPGADILFRPHPEVYARIRENAVCYRRFSSSVTISPPTVPLPQLLDTADHVYVISSLSGFEAVLRDIRTTVFGTPFYAGYGFTDDRIATPRRTRLRTVTECFALAYIRYPHYLTDLTDNARGLISTCLHIDADRETLSGTDTPVLPEMMRLPSDTCIHTFTRKLIRAVKHDASVAEEAVKLFMARFPHAEDAPLRAGIIREANRFNPFTC